MTCRKGLVEFLWDHGIEITDAFGPRIQQPGGIVHGHQGVKRIGQAQVLAAGDVLAVAVGRLDELVQEVQGGVPGEIGRHFHGEFRHQEHQAVAAGLAVIGEDRGIGPQRTLQAQAHAVVARAVFHQGRGLPDAADITPLEPERCLERLDFDLAVLTCGLHILTPCCMRWLDP